MAFPVVGGSQSAAQYLIDNSLRFNDGDSAYLSRTPSTPTSNDIGTFSFWFKKTNISDLVNIVSAYNGSATNSFDIQFHSDDRLRIRFGNTALHETSTSALFRDVSAWYHVLFAIDTTQATASNRIKIYVNGTQITDFNATSYPAQNLDCLLLTGNSHRIGTTWNAGGNMLDGYLAEVYLIDGQALSPTDFGEFDTDNGIWKPIEYIGSYGNNGYYLDFENSGSLGTDQSGNGNNFTPTNLASTDQTTDTPTNNFATLNPLWRNSANLGVSAMAEGNLKPTLQAGGGISLSTQGADTSKWYAEVKISDSFQSEVEVASFDYYYQYTGNGGKPDVRYYYDGRVWVNGSLQGTFSSYTTNDIISIALDLDNNKIYFAKNGTYINSANPSAGTGGFSITATKYLIGCAQASGSNRTFGEFNFGNPSFSITSGNSDDNGYGNFEYAPPTGFLALCTQNLATALFPTVDDGSAYFHTQLYTGNGTSSNVITNDANAGDFQPDWVWIKSRSPTGFNHCLYDSSRGDDALLLSNLTQAETTNTNFGTFDSDGFTLAGSGASFNASSTTYVAWQWKASGGTTSSNTDGSITSTVQANTTAGFSIVTYTGTGANATIGHGLGKVPAMIITKTRDSAANWGVYHQGMDATAPQDYYMPLSLTNAKINVASSWNDTAPTSSVFSVGTNNVTNDTGGMVAYCFAEIKGYSKFGSYTGNGSDDGTFVYTGFRPAFVMMKKTSGTGNWNIFDSTRDIDNVGHHLLFANLSNAEETTTSNRDIDFLSNGFKQREGANQDTNGSGGTYIYMAFAENPFVTSGATPVTAR